MITFVYGAPGSGKTHYIFERLKESHKKAFVIVPEQETVSVERKAVETLDASSQLELEVLNFTRLCNRVFRELGGLSYNYITPRVKKLFMWRTLRELAPLLEEYNSGASDISLTETMQKNADELKICSISSAMLESAAKKLPEGPLRSKIRDIALINAAYTGLIQENFDDRADDMEKLCELLSRHRFFKGAQVFIDSFTSFTAPEYKVIEHIFRQADHVTVTLGCESPDCNLICCESVCDSAKKLLKLAKDLNCESEKIYLTGNFRSENDALASLVTDFWVPGKAYSAKLENTDSVKLVCCRDPYEEAEAAVAFIKSELMRGLRYRDIAVITRSTSDYSGIIDAALENADIPYFMSAKTDVSTSPAVEFLLSALRMICFSYRAEDVLSLLKTGLCNFSTREIDMFEGYVYTWSITGKRFLDKKWTMNPDGYVSKRSDRGNEILESANRVRESLMSHFVAFSEEMDAAKSTKDMCVAVYNLINGMGVPDALRKLAASALEKSQKRRAFDTVALLNTIYDILNDLTVAFPDEKLTDEEFYRAIKLCVSDAQLGSIPTGYDEITVGSAALLRSDNVKVAIILGLNEGKFPAAVKDNGIFTDSDRKQLSELCNITLTSDSVSRAAEELLYARRAIASPSERLYLIYANASETLSPQRPSIIINRIISFFDIKGTDFTFAKNEADAIYTISASRELFPVIKDRALRQAVYEELSACLGEKINPSVKAEKFSVPDELAKEIFTDDMNLSQSAIDKFVKCRMLYYCDNVLKLRPEAKAELDRLTAGTFVHSVLENYLKKHVTQNGFDTTDPEKTVDRIIASIISEICTEDQKNSNRLNHLFLRLRRLSLLMIKSLENEFKSTDFTPEFYELKISKHHGIPPIEFNLKDGSTVTLNGVVDRVDVRKEKGKVYIKVVDYKTGPKKFSVNDIKNGLNLQLLIYLFTLCRKESALADTLNVEEVLPAGASYLSASISSISYSSLPSDEKVIDDALSSINRSGFSVETRDTNANKSTVDFSQDEFDSLRAELDETVIRIAEEMRSGDITALPLIDGKSPCNFCKMAYVCRRAKKSKW